MHDFEHNFNKHSAPNFNKIISVDSKVDTLNNFHKRFIKLQTKESKRK